MLGRWPLPGWVSCGLLFPPGLVFPPRGHRRHGSGHLAAFAALKRRVGGLACKLEEVYIYICMNRFIYKISSRSMHPWPQPLSG